jgi:imidazolonepropionase-like amidohydrolase
MRNRQIESRRSMAYVAALATTIATILVAGATSAADAPAPAAAPLTALQCGHLIDTANGKMLGATTIVIEAGRIKDVSSGVQSPAGAKIIDLSAQTCMPGLIDAHTHLTGETSRTEYTDKFHWNIADYAVRSTVYARRTLLAGFTTVRNLGDIANESVALRNAINAGVIAGPRIYTAGRAVGTTGGHADPTNSYRSDLAGDPGPASGIINNVDDAAKAVRLHYKLGDDLIKIMPSGGVLDESTSGDNAQMTLEEIKAVVATAHDYGFAVAAHAHGAEAIRRAVIGGVDSIEHGTFMDAEDMKLMVEHGTWRLCRAAGQGAGLLSGASRREGGGDRAIDPSDCGARLQGACENRLRHGRRGVPAWPKCS